jgi:FkbM family methyltransferase
VKKLRHLLKKIIRFSPIALTKNEYYDRLTKKVLRKVCSAESVCIDAGTHNGKILKMIIDAAPNAMHYAFEPIPDYFTYLKKAFKNFAKVYCVALSDKAETTTFNIVLSNMAYSGLQRRVFDKKQEDILIFAETDLLDNIIPIEEKITLIKIDVEGAELLVMNGAEKTIQQSKPIILFEFGKEGASIYDYDNIKMYTYITEKLHYQIFTLQDWLKNQSPLTSEQFSNYYKNGKEYFFLAAPSLQ